MTTNRWMEIALLAATEAAARGEVPVGAVIVDTKTNRIIATSSNAPLQLNDPTAHAEILAIRDACKTLNTSRLDGLDIYVTLEPCAMCAQAISHARINRLYFGAYDPKSGGVEHGAKVFSHATCHHKPEVYGGIMEDATSSILQKFFEQKR